MRTMIVGEGRVMSVAKRRINQPDATRLAKDHHLPLTPHVDYDGTVDLWPDRVLDTLEEVHALQAFSRHTDARLRWHPAAAR